MCTGQNRDTRTHSRMYVRGIDAPQKNKKNKNRAIVYFFRQKAVSVTSESGDGRAGKPRHDVPLGFGVKKPVRG